MQSTVNHIKYPEIGKNLRCEVQKISFAYAVLKVLEVEGFKTSIKYKAILKGNGFAEGIYICDKVKSGDVIDCFVVSFGDSAMYVSQ